MFSSNGRIDLQPIATSQESHGKNSVKIDVYQMGDVYLYSIRAKMGNRAWAEPAKPSQKKHISPLDAKLSAMKAFKNWCFNNNLKKQFLAFEGMLYKQLELF